MNSDIVTILSVVFSSTGPNFGATLANQAVPTMDWSIIVSSAIAAAVGAIAGAFAAFRLESRRREKETVERNTANGRRILFDLAYMWNSLDSFKREAIDPLKEFIPEEHWHRMIASVVPYTAEGLLEPNRYEFLLGTNAANLAGVLAEQHQRFQLALSLIRERSRILITHVRPRWEKAGIKPDAELHQIIKMTGPDYYEQLSSHTKNIKTFILEDLESLDACFAELRRHLQELFPDADFIELEKIAPQETANGQNV